MSDRARMTRRSYVQGRSGNYEVLAHVCCSEVLDLHVAWHDEAVKLRLMAINVRTYFIDPAGVAGPRDLTLLSDRRPEARVQGGRQTPRVRP